MARAITWLSQRFYLTIGRLNIDPNMSEKKRISSIMKTLDLGFSDIYEDQNVRQLTLKGKLKTMEKAVELVTLEEAMNFSIFTSKGSDHPTAQIYSLDFPSALRASIYLLLGGYYRQAILCLRDRLEIRLTGIYFGFVDQDRAQYEDWKNGKKSPIGKKLITLLFGRAEFHKFDKKAGLQQRLKKLYAELSAFVHGAGLNRYDLQKKTDNVPRFNAESVDLWFEFAQRSFRELVICYFLAYGTTPFSLQKTEIKTLFHHLPPSYQEELKSGGVDP